MRGTTVASFLIAAVLGIAVMAGLAALDSGADTQNQTTVTDPEPVRTDGPSPYEKGPDYPIVELFMSRSPSSWQQNGSLHNLTLDGERLRLVEDATQGRFTTRPFFLRKLHEYHVNVSIPAAERMNVSLVVVAADTETFADANKTRFRLTDGMNKFYTEFPGGPYFRVDVELFRETTEHPSPTLTTLRVWGDKIGDGK